MTRPLSEGKAAKIVSRIKSDKLSNEKVRFVLLLLLTRHKQRTKYRTVQIIERTK